MALNPNIRKIDSNVFSGLVEQPNLALGQAFTDIAGTINQSLGAITQAKKDKKEADQKERLLQRDDVIEATDKFSLDPQEGDSEAIMSAKVSASNDLANEAAEIERLYRGGDIDIEEYKLSTAKLTHSFQGIKQGDAWINNTAGSYNEMTSNPDSISNAASPEAIAIAKAADSGSITMGWNKDSNRLEYMGTYVDPDGNEQDISKLKITPGKEGRFPRNPKKVGDPKEAFLAINVEVNKNLKDISLKDGIEFNGTSWDDPQVQAKYTSAIDAMVGDTDTLLSAATDHLGIGREEAYRLLKEPVESGGNALQALVKEQLTTQAQSQFFGNESGKIAASEKLRLNREAANRQKVALALKQKQARAAGGKGGTATDRQFQRDVLDARQNLKLIDTSLKDGDFASLTKLPGISKVKKSGNTVKVYDKNGKYIKLPEDPAKRLQILSNYMGIGGAILNEIQRGEQNEGDGTGNNGGVNYSNINTGRPTN